VLGRDLEADKVTLDGFEASPSPITKAMAQRNGLPPRAQGGKSEDDRAQGAVTAWLFSEGEGTKGILQTLFWEKAKEPVLTSIPVLILLVGASFVLGDLAQCAEQKTPPRGSRPNRSEGAAEEGESDKASEPSGSHDWAQWRGPNRDGKSAETGLLKKWPEGGPKLLWTGKGLGRGYSSVSVANGTVYATGEKNNEGLLSAFTLAGELKWRAPYGPEFTKNFPGADSTPTVDDGLVYVISGFGCVVALDAETGQEQWKLDMLKEFDAENIYYGITESALIVDDKLICTPGGAGASIVALHKKTGKLMWESKSLNQKSAFCSPVLMKTKAVPQLVLTMLGKGLVGVNAADGTILWQYEHITKTQHTPVHPNTPVFEGDYIVISSGYGAGTVGLRLSADGASVSKVWSTEALGCHHSGIIALDGRVYGTAYPSRGGLFCLDIRTGRTIYQNKGIGKGSAVYADGMFYCFSERGRIGLVDPRTGDVISEFNCPGGRNQAWAHPTIADGRLCIRYRDSLYVYDVRGK